MTRLRCQSQDPSQDSADVAMPGSDVFLPIISPKRLRAGIADSTGTGEKVEIKKLIEEVERRATE